MASRLFYFPTLPMRTSAIAVGLGLGATVCIQQRLGAFKPMRLDSFSSGSSITSRFPTQDTPVLKQGKLNPQAVRQISMGSILGVLAGLGVSVFSKPLAVLLGLLIVGVQAAESYGIHVVPYKRIQRYFTSIDLKSSLQENVPFKISFGILFALTGFAEFGSGV